MTFSDPLQDLCGALAALPYAEPDRLVHVIGD
jgi:hypothetical protein